MNKLPISGLIVSKNEAHLLENCITSVNFCNEIIVIDLESDDNTIEIAQKCGAKVITVKSLPIVEMIHEKYIDIVQNNWVLITDPDEVTSAELVEDIVNKFPYINNSTFIGSVSVSLVYFFKNHQLKGTSWGGIKSRTYLIHRKRFQFTSKVHNGRSLKDGFENLAIIYNGKNHINHYWMQSYRQLFEKHLRYLKSEGKSRYDSGSRIKFSEILKLPYRNFVHSYIYSKGYKDGFIGFFLSMFRAWYFTSANYALYKYQEREIKKKQNIDDL